MAYRRKQEPERGGASAAFFQLDVSFECVPAERCDWGAVRIRYRAAQHVQYFNLAIAGRWILRNAPLFPAEHPASIETFFYFGLGVAPGVVVGGLSVSTSIASEPADAPPRLHLPVAVLPREESYWTNFQDEPYEPLGAPAGHLPGRGLRPGSVLPQRLPEPALRKERVRPRRRLEQHPMAEQDIRPRDRCVEAGYRILEEGAGLDRRRPRTRRVGEVEDKIRGRPEEQTSDRQHHRKPPGTANRCSPNSRGAKRSRLISDRTHQRSPAWGSMPMETST